MDHLILVSFMRPLKILGLTSIFGFTYFYKALKLHLNSSFLRVWMVTIVRKGAIWPLYLKISIKFDLDFNTTGFISYVLPYFNFCGWCCNRRKRRLHMQLDSFSKSIQLQSTLCMNMSKSYRWNPAKLIERKHPRRERKRKQGARTKVQENKQPNKGGPQGGKGTTKNWTLHQLHEANQLKEAEVNLI